MFLCSVVNKIWVYYTANNWILFLFTFYLPILNRGSFNTCKLKWNVWWKSYKWRFATDYIYFGKSKCLQVKLIYYISTRYKWLRTFSCPELDKQLIQWMDGCELHKLKHSFMIQNVLLTLRKISINQAPGVCYF